LSQACVGHMLQITCPRRRKKHTKHSRGLHPTQSKGGYYYGGSARVLFGSALLLSVLPSGVTVP